MAGQQPAYRAFTVIKREGQDDFWLPIGAAFPHQSGDGFNVILQALPLPDGDGTCKVVLRPPKEDKNDQHDHNDKSRSDERTKQAVRQENDRHFAEQRRTFSSGSSWRRAAPARASSRTALFPNQLK
jgi:hypothetical protein